MFDYDKMRVIVDAHIAQFGLDHQAALPGNYQVLWQKAYAENRKLGGGKDATAFDPNEFDLAIQDGVAAAIEKPEAPKA
ncbi:MAG TPA: hypothetical protein VGC95_09145 [Chitinophagaceae bacterium]